MSPPVQRCCPSYSERTRREALILTPHSTPHQPTRSTQPRLTLPPCLDLLPPHPTLDTEHVRALSAQHQVPGQGSQHCPEQGQDHLQDLWRRGQDTREVECAGKLRSELHSTHRVRCHSHSPLFIHISISTLYINCTHSHYCTNKLLFALFLLSVVLGS